MSGHYPHADYLPRHGTVVYVLEFINPFNPNSQPALNKPMKVYNAREYFFRTYRTSEARSEKNIHPSIVEDTCWWLKSFIPDFENNSNISKKEYLITMISSILYTIKYEFNLDYFLLLSKDRKEIFCKVYVTDEWTQNAAIKEGYFLQLKDNKDYIEKFQEVSPYCPAILLLKKKNNEKHFKKYDNNGHESFCNGSLFKHTDKSRLFIEYLNKRVDLHVLKVSEVMVESFCVHEEQLLQELRKIWASFLAVFKPQPLEDVRSYFSEKITLYFAWIDTYWSFMAIAAVVGIITFIGMKVFGPETIEGTSFQITFAVFLAFWGSAFEQYWRRKEKKLAWRWGTTEHSAKESQRPEFKGIYDLDEVTDKMKVLPSPNEHKILKRLVVYFVVGISLVIVILAVSCIFALRFKLNQDPDTINYARFIPAFLNILQIRILNIIYEKIIIKLNYWENHETESKHNDSLALKTFLFKFFNSYTALFYIAFFKETLETREYCVDVANHDISCDNSISDKVLKADPGCTNCLNDLGFQLGVIFIINLAMNVVELGFPWARWKARMFKAANNDLQNTDITLRTSLYPVEYDSKLEVYENPIQDYIEMIIQFGYVCMFGVAAPIIALLALIEITLEIRVDAWKLCNLTKRPDPIRSDSIGVWLNIISVMAYAGAATNAGIIVFTSKVFDKYDIQVSVLMFFVIENVFIGIMFIVSKFISDVPKTVKNGLEWSRKVVNQKLLLKKAFNEEDVGSRVSWRFDSFFIEKKDLRYQF
ncbi:hypothetical protein SteCoe_7220 [Stentor coeruleus]|uniref:Anoctamin transmembrane domain-containing protein n=1 Tax=Stentor coeruleus TaxID=5963 RepID=A0A1R2CN13_9CILI|nr:hypothetical protein SteCoe_7220 [Stentor coeruleus]